MQQQGTCRLSKAARWLPAGIALLSSAAVIADSPPDPERCNFQIEAPPLRAELTPQQPEVVRRYQGDGTGFYQFSVAILTSAASGQTARVAVRIVPEPLDPLPEGVHQPPEQDDELTEAQLELSARPTRLENAVFSKAFSVSVQLLEGSSASVSLEVQVQGNDCHQNRWLTVDHD